MASERQEAEALDELIAPPPDQNPGEHDFYRQDRLENERDGQKDEPLNELAAPPPDQDVQGNDSYRQDSLEAERGREDHTEVAEGADPNAATASVKGSFLPKLYTVSHLIFFSIMGTLARVGIVALTAYPGAPNANTVLWANVGGCLVIGFLREDRTLFRRHWSQAMKDVHGRAQEMINRNRNSGGGDEGDPNEEAQQLFDSKKATLQIYIGMAVGFCGSFTSFADIIRDAFLALSDDFTTARISTLVTTSMVKERSAGYSVLAVIGILALQIGMSVSALQLGAHIATGVEECSGWIPEVELDLEELINKVVLLLGWGTWIGTVLMAVWPPHHVWRGEVGFAIVFAPLGCLLRFYLAILLNKRVASFPLGTFVANVFGTCVLGMIWDLQHSHIGGILGCQILQGVGDGFCGALTTVSTWVLELKALRLKHSYMYAASSLIISFASLVAIMGSLRWTGGFSEPICTA